jgi:hypothetical protein
MQPRNSVRRLLDEETSDPLGFYLFLPVVTVTVFVTRTGNILSFAYSTTNFALTILCSSF